MKMMRRMVPLILLGMLLFSCGQNTLAQYTKKQTQIAVKYVEVAENIQEQLNGDPAAAGRIDSLIADINRLSEEMDELYSNADADQQKTLAGISQGSNSAMQEKLTPLFDELKKNPEFGPIWEKVSAQLQ